MIHFVLLDNNILTVTNLICIQQLINYFDPSRTSSENTTKSYKCQKVTRAPTRPTWNGSMGKRYNDEDL